MNEDEFCRAPVVIRRIEPSDSNALAAFYNELTGASKRLFHPLDARACPTRCAAIAADNAPGIDTRYDLLAFENGTVVGWGFLWDFGSERPSFGLGVADAYQGRGIGRRLIDAVLAYARKRGVRRIALTVVRDNSRAQGLYERRGFVRQSAFVGEDGLPYYSMTLAVDARSAEKGQA